MSDYFWKTYTEQLVNSLTANSEITKFTNNPAVIGAYAESTVTELIRNFVAPYMFYRKSNRNCSDWREFKAVGSYDLEPYSFTGDI